MSNELLANYAIFEKNSRGRRFNENYDDAKYRSLFGRDRDRIIGSSAFRRLQYKTQVFVNYHGDHYRTRLTHSLEVAQVSRWIAGGLCANKDLAEIISLAHDLGHPPFGHAGEEALNDEMQIFKTKNNDQDFGQHFGFCHNTHSLKLITKLENRFIEFQGLNLTWETLEGVVKHNGPVDVFNAKTNEYIINYNQEFDLDLSRFSSLESQISAISDDIAYNNHDIEDGLRAELFQVEQLFEIEIIGKILQDILKKHPNISRELLVGEAIKQLTLLMVIDAIHNSKKNLEENKITSEEDIRNCNKQLVNFSKEFEEMHQEIKKFLMKNMYRHNQVCNMSNRAQKIIKSLFNFYIKNPKYLPEKLYDLTKNLSKKDFAILISDYIAGMTDRFAIQTYNKLFGYKNYEN